jgi:hypothetical protein
MYDPLALSCRVCYLRAHAAKPRPKCLDCGQVVGSPRAQRCLACHRLRIGAAPVN